ncbi:hypothetical protein ACFL6S_28335 [Candidatus Poribacteria bacterium]
MRIAPSRGYDEEILAQDFFSEDVGRIINFGGSRFLESGNDALREVANKLGDRRVALHANLVLGNAMAIDYKRLVADPDKPRGKIRLKAESAKPEEAQKLLASALTDQMATAVESFGHIAFRRNVDCFSEWLKQQGAADEAANSQEALLNTMSARQVGGRKILDNVLKSIAKQRDSYKK